MPEHCPMCGTPVEIVASGEGTAFYRPTITDEMVDRAVDALLADSGLPRYGGHRATVERRQRLAFAAAFSTFQETGGTDDGA